MFGRKRSGDCHGEDDDASKRWRSTWMGYFKSIVPRAFDIIVILIGAASTVIALLAIFTDIFPHQGERESPAFGSTNTIIQYRQQPARSGSDPNQQSRRTHELLGRRLVVQELRKRILQITADSAAREAVLAAESSPTFVVGGSSRLLLPEKGDGGAAASGGEVPDHLRKRRIHNRLGLTLRERSVYDEDASFFLSIAQYRDVFCPGTVFEIYKNARNPRRVFCGISDQRFNSTLFSNSTSFETVGHVAWDNAQPSDNVDGTCVPWYVMPKCRTSDFCITDNIRARKLWPSDARGPTLGRYYTMLLYQGESYYIMIDSHSRFVKNWDALTIHNLLLVPKEFVGRSVLSHYPNGFEKYSTLISQRSAPFRMVMCSAHFTDAGILRMRSDSMYGSGLPERQPFSAGGFVAGDAAFVHEVPFDPYLYYVFDGEEILYSARLWTSGWEMFTPKNNLLFHHYSRHKAPRFWSNKNPSKESQSALGRDRLHYFLQNQDFESSRLLVDKARVEAKGANVEEDIYGLGKRRTLSEYRAFAAIDPFRWEAERVWCKNNQFFRNGSTYKYHPVIDNVYEFRNSRADGFKPSRYVAGPMKKPRQRLEKEKREQKARNATKSS